MSALLVFLGGALGAAVRFAVATHLDDPERRRFGGTLAVNYLAAFLLGVFTALALDEHRYALLGTGVCGGLSTYSAFAVQATRAGPRAGTVYAAMTILGGVALCAVGYGVGLATGQA